MPLHFPSTPGVGDEFLDWTWDGMRWLVTGTIDGGGGDGGASVDVGASPPATPVVGNLWWNTDDAQLYIWTGLQWVIALNPPGIGAGGGGGGGGITSVTAGTGLTGGTIVTSGTIALATPVSVANGGTASTTGAAALNTLSGVSGTTAGVLQRASNGTWSVGTVSGVLALSGGTMTGQITLPTTNASGNQAVRYNQVNSMLGAYLPLVGGMMVPPSGAPSGGWDYWLGNGWRSGGDPDNRQWFLIGQKSTSVYEGLWLNINPTQAGHAQNQVWVDGFIGGYGLSAFTGNGHAGDIWADGDVRVGNRLDFNGGAYIRGDGSYMRLRGPGASVDVAINAQSDIIGHNFYGYAVQVGPTGVSNIGPVATHAQAGSTHACTFYWGGTGPGMTGSQVGSITNTASSTSFNTSSDARLKEDVGPVENSGALIDAMEPIRFRWKLDGTEDYGFSAQAMEKVYPRAVTPGVGEPGDKDFVPYGMDYAKLVTLLVAEIKSLRTRMAALEHT